MGVLFVAVIAAAFAAAHAKCGKKAQTSGAQAGQWVLTFYDDFNGTEIDSNYWNVNNYSSVISEYDGHDALFIADRVSVSNGSLVIETVLDPRSFNGISYNMTSGWVDTKGKVEQFNGRFEASIKMPDAGAYGAWPAWWLLPNEACWPVSGEVDIVEWWGGQGHYQHNKPGNPISMASTYHYGYECSNDISNYNIDSRWYPNMSNYEAPLIDFSADFHTFGVEINDTAMRFYVDTNTSFILSLPQLCVTDTNFTWGKTPFMPFQPMYGIINTAVVQNANTTWWQSHNATTLVDWVKWYQYVPNALETIVPAAGSDCDDADPFA